MGLKCPKCNTELEVRLTAAPQQHFDRETSGNGGGSIGDLLEQIHDDELDSKSAEFVQQTRERFAQYGDRTRMSDKQMAWLRKLANGIPE